MLNDIIKFKVHIQKNLEDYEGFVVEEVEQELGGDEEREDTRAVNVDWLDRMDAFEGGQQFGFSIIIGRLGHAKLGAFGQDNDGSFDVMKNSGA